jgi:hypothetical protein
MVGKSQARRDLFARVSAFRSALEDPALQPRSILQRRQDPSQLLRNGLAVVAFATLEDFLRRRTQELLGQLPGDRAFGDLSERLRLASRRGALHAALRQARYMANQGVDVQAFLVGVAEEVASTPTASPAISKWSLGYGASNLQVDEVPEILKAFEVEGSWECLNELARRAGSGGLSLRDGFREISKRRHNAAHDGSALIPLSDLKNAPDQVLATTFAFDAACSIAVSRFLNRDAAPTTRRDVGFILIRREEGFRVVEDEEGGILARVPRPSDVRKLIRLHAPRPGIVVFVDRQRLPMGWSVV